MLKKKINKHEVKLAALLTKIAGKAPVSEYRFDEPDEGKKPRRWRFDFAYPEIKVAFEVEGGTWTGGRHVNPIGYAKDCEKYNAAALQGWKVFRLVPAMITAEYIEDIIYKVASLAQTSR